MMKKKTNLKKNVEKKRFKKEEKAMTTKGKRDTFFTDLNPNYIIVAVVLLTIILFYVITLFVSGDVNLNDKKKEDEEITIIQYTTILAGTTFNQVPSNYYVLFYDSKGDEAVLIDTILSIYKSGANVIPYYIVDLNSGFNTPYLSTNSNPAANKASDLHIHGTTLIRVQNQVNAQYIEGIDGIKAVLN